MSSPNKLSSATMSITTTQELDTNCTAAGEPICHLLDCLPVELLTEILKHLLIVRNPTGDQLRLDCKMHETLRRRLNIAQTCKALCHYSMPIYYSENLFTFYTFTELEDEDDLYEKPKICCDDAVYSMRCHYFGRFYAKSGEVNDEYKPILATANFGLQAPCEKLCSFMQDVTIELIVPGSRGPRDRAVHVYKPWSYQKSALEGWLTPLHRLERWGLKNLKKLHIVVLCSRAIALADEEGSRMFCRLEKDFLRVWVVGQLSKVKMPLLDKDWDVEFRRID
jgi:hypothetical protein